MKKHKFNIYPELIGEQLGTLTKSIMVKYDDTFPIVSFEGCVLDGWNRYLVCKELDVTPTMKAFEGTDLEAIRFVDASNARRDLSKFQRVEIALSREKTFAAMAKENLKKSGEQYGKGYQVPDDPIKPINTLKEVAKVANVSHDTIHKAKTIIAEASEETKEKLRAGDVSIGGAYKKIKKQTQIKESKEKNLKESNSISIKPKLYIESAAVFKDKFDLKSIDLLLTDPPYITDIDDINTFVQWLPEYLEKLKPTGRAYIFTGAYPEEIKAYLSLSIPDHLQLSQILVWTYRNTLGVAPKQHYKNNWQAILYYEGKNATQLNCPETAEQWSVQDITAPDGRQGDRFHKWQKPIEIAERFIRHSTQKGDTVIDPFTCTGTFIMAASKLGRIGIGCDIDETNTQIAKDRGCQIITTGSKT